MIRLGDGIDPEEERNLSNAAVIGNIITFSITVAGIKVLPYLLEQFGVGIHHRIVEVSSSTCLFSFESLPARSLPCATTLATSRPRGALINVCDLHLIPLIPMYAPFETRSTSSQTHGFEKTNPICSFKTDILYLEEAPVIEAELAESKEKIIFKTENLSPREIFFYMNKIFLPLVPPETPAEDVKTALKYILANFHELKDKHTNLPTMHLFDASLKEKSNIIKLVDCGYCLKPGDEYAEYDGTLILLDIILQYPKAYRHIIFNDPSYRIIISKLAALTLICDGYISWFQLPSEGEFF
ncbi:ARV1 [Lepeophtheirus salmonis]|uniref:Protein ARV n=1 Tax=Lepeophtheirus salmonis TaxID=72036 RepID=A0A7R8H402_LEPSM|nr:ARV1 [Lepeophtheirus salmonis]CAF2842427.1 ARV1 [Lepeophtheirus salmonis]